VGVRILRAFLTQNLHEEVAHACMTADSKWHSSSFRWNWRNFGFAGDKKKRGEGEAEACYSGPVSYRALLCCSQKTKKTRYGFLKYVLGCLCFIEQFCWMHRVL